MAGHLSRTGPEQVRWGLPKECERRILPAKAQCTWRDKTDGHEILI